MFLGQGDVIMHAVVKWQQQEAQAVLLLGYEHLLPASVLTTCLTRHNSSIPPRSFTVLQGGFTTFLWPYGQWRHALPQQGRAFRYSDVHTVYLVAGGMMENIHCCAVLLSYVTGIVAIMSRQYSAAS
jgi:hypothetical protein